MWVGHIARRDIAKWTRKLTDWTPQTGKRRPGRPKRRWRDDLTGGIIPEQIIQSDVALCNRFF